MYNTIMKLEDLPDFAKPFKKKGYDVRKQGESYFLYKISSHRVPGKKYPVLDQEYIGIIESSGVLINKKEYPREEEEKTHVWLEYGLSSFIMKKYKRALLRSLFNGSAEKNKPLVVLAVVKYVFGSTSDTAVDCCYLAKGMREEILKVRDICSQERLERLVKKIGELEKLTLGNDREDFEIIMRLSVIDRDSTAEPSWPEEALKILENHGVRL